MAKTEPQIKTSLGRYVPEIELQTFVKCSEAWRRKAKFEVPDHIAATKAILTKAFCSMARNSKFDKAYYSTSSALSAVRTIGLHKKLLDSELDVLIRRAIIGVDRFFALFGRKSYHLVSGPTTVSVKVSKTIIELDVIGILRHKDDSTLHIINFSPYVLEQDVLNDPTTVLKVLALGQFIRPYVMRSTGPRPRSELHTVSCINKDFELGVTHLSYNDVSNYRLKRITSMVQLMEQGYAFPISPCRYQCSLKKNCSIGAP